VLRNANTAPPSCDPPIFSSKNTETGTFNADCATRVVAGDTGGADASIKEGFELVVGRHFVALAAFLVEAALPALAVDEIILYPHGDDHTDAGEGVGHDADQGAVAQAYDG
jgi:hypothetical protein